jgi:uncharacterized membrane protein
MFKKYFIILSLILIFLSVSQFAYARNPDEIADWYIQNFDTNISVNKDSSLLITENITADCGNLLDKHGIFRVLPTETKTDNGIYKTPIKLVSITDFNGNPYKYSIINDYSRHTVTWKIGDPNMTVQGVNYYRIVYKVKNAVRFGNTNFDELYWNLSGNFWTIDIDNFSAGISFPSEINSSNAKVNFYTGFLGAKGQDATYSWDNNVLNFKATQPFYPGQGITASITFPKNIFTPYVPTFWEKYGDYFWYLTFSIPLAIFIFAFSKWRKYGKDPKMKKPIPPEFGIPDNITPAQMGVVLSHGFWKNSFITAMIINFAVKKIIIIKELDEKILFFKYKDYELEKSENYDKIDALSKTEKYLIGALFSGKDNVKISSLKANMFYQSALEIGRLAKKDAVDNGWTAAKSSTYSIAFIIIGSIVVCLSVWANALSVKLFLSVLLSGIILILFGLVMPKRTQKGVDLLFKIKGFERYMKQAEDYRQQFYEKENIFDKFLPYAIVFGIAELWAKKMQLIYGEDYFKNYHPVWLVGVASANFDLNSFTSQLNSITASISNNTGGSSGAGGGGGSGGGGGGGGGGGW